MEGSASLAQVQRDGRKTLDAVVVRFAGDSGDGMQLTGSQFTLATAFAGNDLATFPDFPAEIRAPAGSTFGVSAFQIHFGAREILTSGDAVDVLVAMNPAALKTNLGEVKTGGLVLIDTGAFTKKNLEKAGYDADPRGDDTLNAVRPVEIDMSKQTQAAVKPHGLGRKEALRCKNMWALGLVFWMFGRDRTPTEDWLNSKFGAQSTTAQANIAALRAGEAFGETAEIPVGLETYRVPEAAIAPGEYRNVTGTDAMAWGLLAGARLAGLEMSFCSYPITPASQLLHALAPLKPHGVSTFQAEDEIAAAVAALGASYAGSLGVTSSSGPGVALKTEALGLAIATELPLVLVNTQRAGPSTGMPTKTEQSDLFQALYGRNGAAPLVVLAARSPADCFDVAVEAVRLATRYMTPVMVLSDGYLANASEPWRIPDVDRMTPFPVAFARDPEGFQPYRRDPQTGARPWAVPGTPGMAHRIGGLEKRAETGEVSYDPDNHQAMTDARARKVQAAAEAIPEQTVEQGPTSGRLAVVGWGSTYGAIHRAVAEVLAEDPDAGVAQIHLRHLWPLPKNLGELLRGFDRVLVPEMNDGQLVTLLRAQYLVPATGLDRTTGRPFKIAEIERVIRAWLED